MKKLTFLCFSTLLFAQSCVKENSDCGCDSKGEFFENVSATVTKNDNFNTIRLDNAINGTTDYGICNKIPDSLKIENQKIIISGFFKKNCPNPTIFYTSEPLTLSSIKRGSL